MQLYAESRRADGRSNRVLAQLGLESIGLIGLAQLSVKIDSTLNLDFTEWDQAFPANPLLASATLDRLRHNAYCLVLDGQSYRTPRQMPTTMPTKTKNSTQLMSA